MKVKEGKNEQKKNHNNQLKYQYSKKERNMENYITL